MIDIGMLTLAQMYELRVELSNRIEAVESEAYEDLNQGKSVVGFELKKGRKQRKWTDTTSLVQHMREHGYSNKDLYDAKIKGIPALEKLTKGTDIDLGQFIEVSTTKPTLVYTGESE